MNKDIGNRKLKILKAVVLDYIMTGEPVGSRTLEKKYDLGVSAATIRNEMKDLEELGYLDQIHTSSGRVPSSKGFRIYVDKLMTLDSLTLEEVKFIENQIVTMAAFEIEKIMRKTAFMLSELTNLAVVAKKPSPYSLKVKAIQLVCLEKESILAVIMVDNGSVKHQLIKVKETPNQEILLELSDLLTLKLRGMTISDINLHIVNDLKGVLEGYEELFLSILQAIYDSLSAESSEDYYIEGATKVLSYPEFSDVNKMKDFLGMLDNPSLIFKDIENELNRDENLIVTIGEELDLPEAKDVSIITANYKYNGHDMGTINLIGPKRLDYSKVLSILNGVIDELDNKLIKRELDDGG